MASKNKASDVKKGSSAPIQPPLWTEYLCCSMCEKHFNRTDRCPISLGCGHTLCRSCLGKLKHSQCHFDQTRITCNKFDLPTNSALLQLLPGDSENAVPQALALQDSSCDSNNINQYLKSYETAKSCIEELALYLKPGKTSDLSRPMQRKLVALINCQLIEAEGRKRALRACRALGERTATELILLHQNPTTLSASLWAAVRARGCQFLGPAMQEEALKLIHLALDYGSELSRKVLVQIVVKNLQTQFSQASKTSIGHVVQLLYRASCFKVEKRVGESSLMCLKEEFLKYEKLRKEHDTQIVQIAREAGLRIAPDQWSALLYGDQAHKPHMQSIIDKLQSDGSFQQCIADLSLALKRSCDPGNIQSLLLHFKFLSEMDTEMESWDSLEKSTCSAKLCVKHLVEFTNHNHHWTWQCQEATQQTSKYKTSMCRDSKNKRICPRGQSCTFAHSEAELQHYRNRRKKGGQISFSPNEFKAESSNSCESVQFNYAEQTTVDSESERPVKIMNMPQQTHICQCGNSINQSYGSNMKNPNYFVDQVLTGHSPTVFKPATPQNLTISNSPLQSNIALNPPVLVSPPPQVASVPNIMQPHSHYVARNQVIYEAKHSAYESAQCSHNGQHQFVQGMPIAAVEVQNSSIKNPAAVLHPNHYVVHRQQSPGFCQMQANQVHPVFQEPVPPHAPSFSVPPPPYTCLTLQNGQQVTVPTPQRPGAMPQSSLVFQPPSIQVHNMPSTQPMNYQQSMVVPTVNPTNPITAMPSMVTPAKIQDISKPVYDQYHLIVPSKPVDTLSLTELRHRKEEVINKLVKKRIVAPKCEENLHHKFGSYCDIPVEESAYSPHNEYISSSQPHAFSSSANATSISVVETNSSIESASEGHYSLWTGITCIPNISNLSCENAVFNENPSGIDVVSDLDTSTSQVAAFQDDNSYLGKYSNVHFENVSSIGSNKLTSLCSSVEDEILPIQDQRIVSKYGPIARTVRSKTTAAIPEQAIASGTAITHPFLSDKNRNKSNFCASEPDVWSQNMMFIRSEVEPTAVSNESYQLPDVVRNNYTLASTSQNVRSAENASSQSTVFSDANEDLMLAIELQEIEMKIQSINRDASSK